MGCGASSSPGGEKGQAFASLLKQLKDTDAEVRRKAVRSLGEIGEPAAKHAEAIAELMGDSDLEVRRRASKALARLGDEAGRAVAPRLARRLSEAKIRTSVEEALKELGASASTAVPELREYLSADTDICIIALRLLGHLGPPHATPAAEDVVKLLANEDAEVSKNALDFLECLGPEAAAVASELSRLLGHDQTEVRLKALKALGGLGGAASVVDAAPALAALVVHDDENVRRAASEALGQLGDLGEHSGPVVAAEMAVALGDTRADVCKEAARLLARLGPYAAPHASALVVPLKRDDVRAAASEALSTLALHAELAVVPLAKLLDGKAGDEVCLAALDVLGKLGRIAEPAAGDVATALASDSYEVRTKAVEVLICLGALGCAGAAMPAVTKLLADDSAGVRASAAEALKGVGTSLGSGTGAAAAEVAKLLASGQYGVRSKALETLDGLGPEAAAPAAPEIARLLAHDNPDVRQVAEEVLRRLGGHGVAAAPLLLELLTHRKEHVRLLARNGLKQLGDNAVPAIVTLLRNTVDWQDRRRVVEQLGRLGALAKPFVPTLGDLLDDDSLELQIAAACLLRDLASKDSGFVMPELRAKAQALLEKSLEQHSTPSYWINGKSSDRDFDEMVYVDERQHDRFDELLKQTYVARSTQDRTCPQGRHGRTKGGCPCVQPGGDPGLPTEYIVRRVLRVENALMWGRYLMKKDVVRLKRAKEDEPFKIFDPPIMSTAVVDANREVFAPREDNLNESYLVHGTFVRAAVSIAKNNFNIDLAGSNTGTMYGIGAYLGESITKADEYARDEPDGYYSGIYAALVCRVCMGKLYYTTQRDTEAGAKVSSGSFDSTCGDRSKVASTFRELVVYDNDQIYPEYIVFYQRLYARNDRSKVCGSLGWPLHTEMPPYWTNGYKDMRTGEPFDERYEVTSLTLGVLQRLAGASLEGASWEVVAARRVENAVLWRAYADAKAAMRCRLVNGGSEAKELATAKHLRAESSEQCLSSATTEASLNEHFLWHATSRDSAESIARAGFQIDRSGSKVGGLRFGPGAYFSEGLSKALAYAMDEEGAKYVLLCRVACGRFYEADGGLDPVASSKASQGGQDAVLARAQEGAAREVVALHQEQVYPEFVLELRPAGSQPF